MSGSTAQIMRPVPTVEAELIQDEGEVYVPRKDTLGRWFCGVGCDLAAHGMVKADGSPVSMTPWSMSKIFDQLDKDIATATAQLHEGAPWVSQLDPIRQRVLLNMTFNMGWLSADRKHGLGTFTATLALIQAGHYQEAAAHMLASAWASQVKARATRLAARMATGDYWATWAPGQVIAEAPPPVPAPEATTPDAQESPSLFGRILSFLHLR